MNFASVVMPDGRSWVPKFVKDINREKCIGCGRCFKVCGREVLQLMGMDDQGELIAMDADEDDDEEYEKKVMTVANEKNCIGCEACAKICPKKCYSHEALAV
ncbi:MAG: ferredoxin III, nif-specific [Hydrogenophilales bacterium CG_4_10_14_3_um_filter_58_23]|nr:MAG: ferredoxin III, nif-specific [Hydrogenophilales bacterium CG18_big_fil_WC_8_21_14_2_50_58_12]PIY00705.1 MAG: ferredoxin III, nif-specific [Hydrogenophilales bacterium CG_4_10_14_3_um_filter_58_23]